jgi:hypothetical protein
MALWPPSFINCNKSSLSDGAFKLIEKHFAIQIKNSHERKKSRKHFTFLAADKRDVLQTLCRKLGKAMRYIVC